MKIIKPGFVSLIGFVSFILVLGSIGIAFDAIMHTLSIHVTDTAFIIFLCADVVIAFAVAYLIVNVVEGKATKEVASEMSGSVKDFGHIILIMAAAVAAVAVIVIIIYGANTFVSGTPIWAIVIIVLLVLILMK